MSRALAKLARQNERRTDFRLGSAPEVVVQEMELESLVIRVA